MTFVVPKSINKWPLKEVENILNVSLVSLNSVKFNVFKQFDLVWLIFSNQLYGKY